MPVATLQTLFNNKRRDEIRDALHNGGQVFRRRGQSDPGQDDAITIQWVTEHPEPSAKSQRKRVLDPVEKERLGSMLLLVVKQGDSGAARSALTAGADPNARDWRTANPTIMVGMPPPNCGDTALMIAAGKGDMKMVKLLVSFGADVNLEFNYGSCPFPTAMTRARDAGYDNIVEFLKKQGAVR